MQLDAKNLSCTRLERKVLKSVSFVVKAGEALVVKGANGSGKSTLLSILAGQITHYHGHIELSGINDEERPRYVHWLGHKDGLKATLSVKENLNFTQTLLGSKKNTPSMVHALKLLGLAHLKDMPVVRLSAGQRRRVALARLLLSNRPVWLLDEPTNVLDQAGQDILRDLITKHLAHNGLVIVATHLEIGLPNSHMLHLS